MSLYHWLSRLLEALLVRPPTPVLIQTNPRASRPVPRPLKTVSWRVGAGLCLALVAGQAWGGMDTEQKEVQGTIVAAGFGYQIGEVSTITVKVYDAGSGEVLSDDTYELNVNDGDAPRSNGSQERIFAGGVGLGATDLSNFVLRVYDARTGRFQWEGQLNLTPRDGGRAGQLVSTLSPRRASVTKIHTVDASMRQPSFLLRALDASTGGLVWEDEFSTEGAGSGKVERIAARLSRSEGDPTDASHTFDFRIRMFDRNGQDVLWEDLVSQQEAEEDSHEAVDDQARMIPAWPRQTQSTSSPEQI